MTTYKSYNTYLSNLMNFKQWNNNPTTPTNDWYSLQLTSGSVASTGCVFVCSAIELEHYDKIATPTDLYDDGHYGTTVFSVTGAAGIYSMKYDRRTGTFETLKGVILDQIITYGRPVIVYGEDPNIQNSSHAVVAGGFVGTLPIAFYDGSGNPVPDYTKITSGMIKIYDPGTNVTGFESLTNMINKYKYTKGFSNFDISVLVSYF